VRRYWRCFVTVSFPRLRPAEYADTVAPCPLADRDLARLVCAFRLLLPDVGIVLSTREPAALRDGLVKLGVTQMSAGSRTEPGGYSAPDDRETGRQFEIGDARDPAEISATLRRLGFDPVWKDWESALHG
jgi:2-iminoacetate synthase